MKKAKFFIYIGRLLSLLSLTALIGAWASTLKGAEILGMSQQHLFMDAITLALLSIICLLDGMLHKRNL